jgi:hypothetical protein
VDRASTFADPEVIRRLQTEFVPVAANIADIGWGRTPASRWFLDVAGQVNYRVRSGETIQGFYTAGPDKKAYGFDNIRDPKRVLKMLDDAYAEFLKHAPENVAIPPADIEAPFSKSPDKATSVIRVFTRIRPLPVGAHRFNNYVGRDHLWVLGKEIKEIIGAGATGKSFKMPQTLAGRITRFHLVDNVRGEPDMWQPEHIRKADFELKLIASSRGEKTYSIKGTFAMKYANGSRGQNGTLTGEMTVTSATLKVVKFRAYSEGEAWGESKYTPLAPQGRFPIVIGMIEANDQVAMDVPPEALSLGGDYFEAPCSCFKK